MATKEALEKKRKQFLWEIGELYAKTSPELSRYYFSKYQSLIKHGQSDKNAEKLCEYCGNLFDGSNTRTRILKKIRTRKNKASHKNTTKRLRKNCVVSIRCGSCENILFKEGSKKIINPTHTRNKKAVENQETPKQEDVGPTQLPENYSSLSTSAKRKWRNKIRINKLKEKGDFFNWKSSVVNKSDTKTNLVAFLSNID